MKLRFGLLGEGIGHSRQPQLLRYLARKAGLGLSYELLDRRDNSLFDIDAELASLREAGFHGINVTHPFKQRIAPLVTRDETPAESLIGTYNTLRFDEGGIVGANTDYSGFKQGYRRQRGDARPGSVLVCGAGGVGRAIAIGLAELGATELLINDVVSHQSQALVDSLQKLGYSATGLSTDELPAAMSRVNGLVNCTALGMVNHPGSAFPVAHIGGQEWAFDAVYTPLETEFLANCRRRDLDVISGFNLWLFQGLDTFRIFTGITVEADDEVINTAFCWQA